MSKQHKGADTANSVLQPLSPATEENIRLLGDFTDKSDDEETVPIATYQALLSENDGLQDTIIALRHNDGILKEAIEKLEDSFKIYTQANEDLTNQLNNTPVIDFDTNTLVNTAELDTIIQQNADLKADMGTVVNVLQSIVGLFTGKVSPFSIPMYIGKIMANPGQMDAIKGLTQIIEKYTPKAENHVG
jgi:hypothetical protein